MELTQKILDNLREQYQLAAHEERAREQLSQIIARKQTLAGGLAVLADLFEEEHGTALQHTIDSDPEWQEAIRELRENTQKT